MSLKFGLIITFMASTLAHAFEPSTLTLEVINHSSQIFKVQSTDKAPGNKISIDKSTLKPGDTCIITGTITTDNDLLATLHFQNNERLVIKDRRQFHTGQPVFYFDANSTHSKVTKKVRNPIVKPRLLSIIEAVVEISDKIGF